jgi:hypothetical protein
MIRVRFACGHGTPWVRERTWTMHFRVFQRRGQWHWQLRDRRERLVARSLAGYRTFSLAKDYARYTMEGLQNCLRQ